MNYIPLNVKTSYFLLSSLNDITILIEKCKAYNINALAITDPNMFGVMEFYKVCQKNNIKPIIGLELELDDNKLYLYAKNYQGYQNLTRLLYQKQEQPLTLELLKAHREYLICIVPFASIPLYKDLKSIYSYIYLAYQNLKEREQLKKVSKKIVFMNEVLYPDKKDALYLKYLYLIRDGKKNRDLNEYQLTDDHHLMTIDEVLSYSLKEDLKWMQEIEGLCHITFNYNQELLPKYIGKHDFEDHLYLKSLCKKGLQKRLGNKILSSYVKRLKYELEVVGKMGFDNYFLVVWDFVKYAKRNNILVGPGRGSSAGSLISYCLGITDVDPLKYNLLFERFLNPERISMPDIDIDFESNRRGEVVNYVINKYGHKKAMPIITFVTLGGKQVIRDLGRIFEIDSKLLDELCKLINSYISLKENLDANNNLKKLLTNQPSLLKLYKIAYKLEGMKRQISVHAAGVVISALELDNYLPLQKYDQYYITGFSMEHLEALGLLKIDFLGLKNLTLIEDVLKKLNEEGHQIAFNQIPIDDQKTFDLFSNALTDGIFQFESVGMKNFISKLKPNNFEDLVAAIALFRPGPMANIGHYISRKNGYEKIDYLHSDLYEILKPTYGIIVYQEQIMQIAHLMAGYSLGEADVLRRAMSKKKREILENEQQKFISRSISKGYHQDLALKVYRLILRFANYGFNRAHSVAYALIGYRMAYLKVHYKSYFMSSLLTNVIGSEVKTKEYIRECKLNKIDVLKPDINKSAYHYQVVSKGIRFSLAAIRNVGVIACREILKIRDEGLFNDFFDFVSRTYGRAVNRKTIESLIDADCFKDFGYNHQTLYHNIEAALNYADLVKQVSEKLIEKPVMEAVVEYNRAELAKKELQVFGFYLNNHPTSKYSARYQNLVTMADLKKHFDKVINCVLYLEKVKKIATKNKDKMILASASDEFGSVDLVIFPKLYSKYEDIKAEDIVYVSGRVEKRMSKYQLNIFKLTKLS